ncbi:hypothetical protein BH11MYX2_BH11MYX2_12630 [soil metagenome]
MRFALAFLSLAACSTYTNHRAALVPHATPVAFDGQPMENNGQISIGADNLFDLARPTAGDPTQGDQVPAQQFRGMAALRVSNIVSISGIVEHASAGNSTVLKSDAPRIIESMLDGIGLALRFSIPTQNPAFRIGLAIEGVVWNVPWVEFSTCDASCVTVTTDQADLVPTLGVALIPSYRVGRVTLFGGATIRNQPTITQETITYGSPDSEGPNSGSWAFTFHAGVGVELGHGVRANTVLHDTVGGPVAYGPSVAFELAIPLGDRAQPAAPAHTASSPAALKPPTSPPDRWP